jgi:Flp pilus assembly protein TadB
MDKKENKDNEKILIPNPFEELEELTLKMADSFQDPLEKRKYLENVKKTLDAEKTVVIERFEATRRREKQASLGFWVLGVLFLVCVGFGVLFLGVLGAFLGLIVWLLIILIVGKIK